MNPLKKAITNPTEERRAEIGARFGDESKRCNETIQKVHNQYGASWIITDEDIVHVLSTHDLPCGDSDIERARAAFDEPKIIQRVFEFTDLDDQSQSALGDIETQLVKTGVVPVNSQQKFPPVT